MLNWALVFFIVAIVAGVFSFGGVQTAAVGLAQILFYVFAIIFLILVIVGVRRPPSSGR